jgi:hypothetical protein
MLMSTSLRARAESPSAPAAGLRMLLVGKASLSTSPFKRPLGIVACLNMTVSVTQ